MRQATFGDYALFHSSELDMAIEEPLALTDGTAATFAPGWYVCPCIPEGAIIDHRMRGPFATTAEGFKVKARIEMGYE